MSTSIVRYLVAFLAILNIAVSVAAETRPTPAAKATPESVEGPRIPIVEIRRTTGPWNAILKSEEGGYLRIDISGYPSTILPEDDVTSFTVLDAEPPRKAVILLISLEQVATRKNMISQVLRTLQRPILHEHDTVYTFPKVPPQNPWGQLDAAKYDDSGDEYLLSFLTTEAELAEKFRSADIEDRQLALSAFLKIRGSVSNKYIVEGAVSEDVALRKPAIAELEKRGVGTRNSYTKFLEQNPEAELVAKLRSSDIEDRRFALFAFLKIRGDVSNKYIIEAALDEDETLRKPALEELEWRGVGASKAIAAAMQLPASDREKLAALRLRVDYATARRGNSASAYSEFLRQHPASKYDFEMRYRMLSERKDTTGLKRLLASNPASSTVRDIVDLIEEGKIAVSMRGSGIDSVEVSLHKLTPELLQIRVPLGSYFVAERSSSQNMVVTEEKTTLLIGEDPLVLTIPAACANRERKVPYKSDSFSVLRPTAVPQPELASLMPELAKANVSFPIRQAAVWIVTDNADYAELGILVQRPQYSGSGGTRQINEMHIVGAMQILDKAGIDVTKKSIWKIKDDLLSKLSDAQQRKWLESKMAQAQ
mgnify:CR=1 FL=1